MTAIEREAPALALDGTPIARLSRDPMPAPLRLGRHPEAHIRPLGDDESMVSRNHAELHYKDSRLSLLDVGSTHITARTQVLYQIAEVEFAALRHLLWGHLTVSALTGLQADLSGRAS